MLDQYLMNHFEKKTVKEQKQQTRDYRLDDLHLVPLNPSPANSHTFFRDPTSKTGAIDWILRYLSWYTFVLINGIVYKTWHKKKKKWIILLEIKPIAKSCHFFYHESQE
ncbi:MAG: hypothetical protein A2V66_15495 [Ignavibacteria bacterium RBG_13_36_8]|nr:MAG: hypothetical protein A2V66_15495 [Ignavibacteria bacterium RBG_13_36_8]